jgi:hypothetical protein
MKKIKIITILILTLSITADAQKRFFRIKEQVSELAKATLSNDYEKLIMHTYPKLIELMGGREKMKSVIISGMDNLKEKGISIEDVSFGEPGKIYKAGKERHCLVPEKIVMKIKGGHMIVNSYLLAISGDKGKFWYFLDCSNSKENLLPLFPNFNHKLIIPERQDPIIIKE